MSKKTFYEKYYADQPKLTKGIINVIVVGGLAYIGWELYRSAKNRKKITDAGQFPAVADAELKKLAERGIVPSYYKVQYESYAQQLAQAMGGCGTDEAAILRVMQAMKNDADILMLVRTFGVRPYEPCQYTDPFDHATWVFNPEAFPMSLDAWFSRDLSTGDLKDVNAALAKNNVTFRF